MANSWHWLTVKFADKTSILALVTAVLLIVLYAFIEDVLLLVAFLPYAVLGAVGVYLHQRGLSTAAGSDGESTQEHYVSIDTSVPLEAMNEVTQRMTVTVDGLVRATQAINEVTGQQSSSAEEQVSVITSANSMLDTFLEFSEQISEQVRQVTQSAQKATEISASGQSAIEQSLQAMNDIRQQVTAIGQTIVKLAKLTSRIDAIISSVSEIATQSNLLALNASIEAARAGQHGRGFAVVADEVRTLAKQSTNSAAQVREILSEIQRAMKETVQATQQGMHNVDQGVMQTREANEVIIQLAANVKDSREAVSNIYEVVRQQADGMEEIAINMDRMQRITQQSLASTRTVESVSANLTRLAGDLQEAVTHTDSVHPMRVNNRGRYSG